LSTPFYVSKEWILAPGTPRNRAVPPCDITDEGLPEGQVQRWLPGQNPNLDEMTKLWGIPATAVAVGAETMYPEYRKQLKDTYVRPKRAAAPN
jgi:hypothetical protein